jgi:hypothetical protein
MMKLIATHLIVLADSAAGAAAGLSTARADTVPTLLHIAQGIMRLEKQSLRQSFEMTNGSPTAVNARIDCEFFDRSKNLLTADFTVLGGIAPGTRVAGVTTPPYKGVPPTTSSCVANTF